MTYRLVSAGWAHSLAYDAAGGSEALKRSNEGSDSAYSL